MTRLGKWRVVVAKPEEAPRNILLVDQVHGADIVPASQIVASRERSDGDGIFLDLLNVSAGIVTADCLPLVIAWKQRALVLHVSRASAAAGILDNAARYLTGATNVCMFLGPHICARHFIHENMGEDLRILAQRFPGAISTVAGIYSLSLRDIALWYARRWNIDNNNVYEDGRCTFEDADLASYRRNKKENTGRGAGRILTYAQPAA